MVKTSKKKYFRINNVVSTPFLFIRQKVSEEKVKAFF